ncbi:lipid A export permease/ATP-binding protein MsbA [Vitreoscilla stercoraria]|uniref:Lipid A export permease/ATP-binding protein MsbA n=1 Tax=Vitreoscilla stercoraria TaxID=61 RepID=A0ABY4E8D2_VITST|nr:lipid A export permease/ATP-binding protein MsbA [Vitreoscilla stercoraria]UOO91603.1 lipid A export permease/ATP-binding protein MsbA [Vitreoscilla stercoraria]
MASNSKPESTLSGWELYKRIFPYLRHYWLLFVVSLVAMAIAAATEPAFVALLKPLIDEGFVGKNAEAMQWIPFAIIGLFVLRGVTSFINEYATSLLAGTLVKKMREELFDKLLDLPMAYYADHQSGRMISRITNDVTQISNAGFNIITVTVKDGVTILGLLGWLVYTDWQLTLIMFVLLPTVAVCVRFVSKRLRKLSRKNQQYMGEMTQALSESVHAAKVVKVYGGQAQERVRFGRTITEVLNTKVKQSITSSLNTGITQLIIAVALSIILYFAAERARSNAFTAGDFLSYLSAMLMLFAPFKRITNMSQTLQLGLAAAESVFAFLDEKGELNQGTKTLTGLNQGIALRDVVFRYTGAERNAINGLNLDIQAGKVVALVGASGCGKTTLANMLSRFLIADSGRIEFDGVEINDLDLRSLRSQIALVSQDVVLFNGSILENIAYGELATHSREAVEKAAKMANAWQFIEKLPQGLDTLIGENGTKLSGGQRQRIAIARALLKNAPILILDEATSALDNESERLVQAALEQLMQARTTIVIAHRLSTIEQADLIVVMDHGEVVEQGTHSELLQQQGRYAHLHSAQLIHHKQT